MPPLMEAPTHTPVDVERETRELEQAARRLEHAEPQDILRWAVERYPDGLVMACSFGMQSVVMLDMLHRQGLLNSVEVFYLDTGVLFQELAYVIMFALTCSLGVSFRAASWLT